MPAQAVTRSHTSMTPKGFDLEGECFASRKHRIEAGVLPRRMGICLRADSPEIGRGFGKRFWLAGGGFTFRPHGAQPM